MHKYNEDEILNKIDDPSIDLEEENEDDEIEISQEQTRSRKLYIDKGDKSVSDLFRMIREKEINLQPDFQRKFIWDKKTMSRFIESLLLSIPIPTIFLSENNDGTYDVIDGQQRLTTIFTFMKDSLSQDEIEKLPEYIKEIPSFKLSGLETLKEFNSKSYIDVIKEKKKFLNVFLPVVIIEKDSSEDIKYDIFSRINRGSVRLNSQELLNVMYRGKLISVVNELANMEIIDNVFNNRPVLKKRYGYNEIIIRAIAMNQFIDKDWNVIDKELGVKNQIGNSYNGRLHLSIIDYLAKYRNNEMESLKIKEFIIDSFEKIQLVFGDDAFKRINNPGSTSINKTIAETQIITLSRFSKEIVENNKDKIKESFNSFITSQRDDLFTKATNNTNNVKERYKWGKILSEELEV